MAVRLSLALALLALLPASALAIVHLPASPRVITGNPADRMLSVPIEPSSYDGATHCAAKPHPGMPQLQHWLETHSRGAFWGSYRCEKWGKHSASLHAENRAIDWHLDVGVRADRRAAEKLIRLLLAPDAAGNPQALARRMGVEELIWDCGYWGAGMSDFTPYSPCYSKRGKLRRHVDPTIAHRNHVHIGMTKAGANARTSFWERAR